MDEFVSIDEALTKLQGFTRYDLFYAVIDGRISMYWCPTDGIDVVKVELVKTTDLDGMECDRWRRVKSSVVSEHEFGPFLIDTSIDELWPNMLSTIKDRDSILDSAPIDSFSDPIKFKDLKGCVYATHFDDPFAPVLPKSNELRVMSSDLINIKKILKAIREGSASGGNFVTASRLSAIRNYLNNSNGWGRLKEKISPGNLGFRDEVWKAVENTKDKNGIFIFAKTKSKDSNFIFVNTPDKPTFCEEWKKIKVK